MTDLQSSLPTQILQAAYRCLAQKGSAHVSLRDIAKEAGVALSQLHYYFGSREGLLVAAASFVLRQQIARLQAELEPVQEPAERVKQAIRFISGQRCVDSDWSKVHLDLLAMGAWSPTLAAETRRLHDELLEVILSEGLRTGKAHLGSRAVARLVLGALDGLAMQALNGADATEVNAAYEALEQILIGLL